MASTRESNTEPGVKAPGVLFGAAYYHEYQPYERLDADIDLMRKASMSVVRIGESTWSRWEPEDGRFETDWIGRVIDAVHEAGIKVILGTPTYAIPAWLWRKHPEIMADRATGSPMPYGGRQNVDFAHPAFRFHAERVVRTVVSRFAMHPAVIGYQLDNETGLEILHNHDVFQGFVDYLRSRYGSVEEVNERWGLTYWSHELGSWSDLWPPDGNTTPGYDLEWRRYQARLTSEFLSWQAGIVRELARPDQFCTQCLVAGHGRPAANRFDIAGVLDIAAENVYYPMQDALELAEDAVEDEPSQAHSFTAESGVWSLFMKGDMARATKQSGFLVTETNALSIGDSHENFPAYDGQWRLGAYALISRGAQAISYWHFHSCHTGHETFWQGMVNHDLEPNRCFAELGGIGVELSEHAEVLDDIQPDADVALLYSYDSKYALSYKPPLRLNGVEEPDRRSYERIFNACYRAFFDARAQVQIVAEDQDWERFPVLVVPALYIASDDLVGRLLAYAQGGGHLVLTFRSGYADADGRVRPVRAPGLLRNAVGASYQEYSNLVGRVRVVGDDDSPRLPADAAGLAWADGLVTEGATALASYDDPHFRQFAAATVQSFGAGRVTYIGTLPSASFGRWLAEGVLRSVVGTHLWSDLPFSVRANSARARSGARLWFLGNWSWSPAEVVVPATVEDLGARRTVGAGEVVRLGAWDLRLLLEPGPVRT
ncbi:MAG: bga11 [Acidimicrobiaceae bacterium]|nr:bga11 [Acidimicrobiaceae bacterium]